MLSTVRDEEVLPIPVPGLLVESDLSNFFIGAVCVFALDTLSFPSEVFAGTCDFFMVEMELAFGSLFVLLSTTSMVV
jgi:hypothetical protein